ncbi:hypothetical protein NMY22_g2396 [Coprinellus aureogranulatus]|nr:hypothetical protein NMY22_g2396 [Coprinellus aureogranulatus]
MQPQPPQSSSPSPPLRDDTPPPDLESPALQRLQSLLRQPLRISINDGRIFLGTFAGTDKPLNILLANAEEYRIGHSEELAGRYVGQILIPWKLVTKVEAAGQGGSVGSSGRDSEAMYL